MIKLLIDVFLKFDSIPDWNKTEKICHRVVSGDPFMIAYCSHGYKTQRMCDEAVNDCLATLKFIPDWFVTSKMLE